MPRTLTIVFFVGLAGFFVYGLFQQMQAARNRKPQLYNRPIWLVVIYDCGAALALIGFLTSALMQSGSRWQEQLMYFGIGTLGVGGECEVLASFFEQPPSDNMKHWATRAGIALTGVLLMYVGFGKLSA